MDRTPYIEKISQRMQQALHALDWDLIDTCVRELAPQLSKLGAAGPWTAGERAALLQLRSVHDRVASASVSQMQSLQAKMDEMNNNQEGWMAYAMSEEHDTGHTQG